MTKYPMTHEARITESETASACSQHAYTLRLRKRWPLLPLCTAVLALALSAESVWADTARRLVKQGNLEYSAQNYDNALSAYDDAEELDENSPCIKYDKGNAYYRKGDYASAMRFYEQAATSTDNRQLKARSKPQTTPSLTNSLERNRSCQSVNRLTICAFICWISTCTRSRLASRENCISVVWESGAVIGNDRN